MSDETENKGYNKPRVGEEDWHVPLNENFDRIDADIHEIEQDLDGSGDPNGSGLERRRRNVGPMPTGGFHDTEYPDGGYGIVFEAADLHIESVVVEPDDGESGELEVELRRYESGADNPTILDSVTHSVSPGPQRITLDFDVPASDDPNADENDEYVLQRGDTDELYLRRWHEDEGWTDDHFDMHTYTDPDIDFLTSVSNAASHNSSGPRPRWVFFFDWLVGPKNRLPLPRSTDVEEIYMRPDDPRKEFDDVSPRALWIDTS